MSTASAVTTLTKPLSREDVADAKAAMEATYGRPDLAGVCVAEGFGCRVAVRKGHLVAEDGIGPHRRTRTYARATHGLRRLVLANPDGYATFEALRWCSALGIGVVMLGPGGVPVLQSAPRTTDDARLRRAQALAPGQPVGLGVARHLLGAKVRGQANLVRHRFGELSAADDIDALAEGIDAADALDACRGLEAEAANIYFGTWAGRPECVPRFPARDKARVPAHWLTYYGRRSFLLKSSGNRAAVQPTNALLNYCFALLEAEATIACHAVGLDAGLGFVHLDARGRQSMALDIMEPVRPKVEGYVLDLLTTRTFRKAELVEALDGQVRLRPPLTHELCEAMPLMAAWLAPYAEKVAHMLGEAMEGKYVPVTPLTTAKHRAAQAVVKARKAAARDRGRKDAPKQRPAEVAPLPRWTCPGCGAPVANARHVLCPECQAKAGHTPAVRQTRGRAIASRKALLRASAEGLGFSADKDWYRAHILPGLASHKLSEIVACGVSKGYASYIRSGQYVPNVALWPTLARLVGIELPNDMGTPEPVEAAI